MWCQYKKIIEFVHYKTYAERDVRFCSSVIRATAHESKLTRVSHCSTNTLRRSQTTRFLLPIACDLHRVESGGILHNRVQSDGIVPNRMQSRGIGGNTFGSMNRQIHRIGLNKTSRYTTNCYCKVTLDYSDGLLVSVDTEKNVDVQQ